MLVRSVVIPVLALAGVGLALYTAKASNKPVVPAQPVAPPAVSPFGAPVAGAGIVEASTRNIAIGTNVPGIVTKVHVKVGDTVTAGAPLFSIDDRTLQAELHVREAGVAVAERTLAKWKAPARAEDIPPLEARIAEARAALADAEAQYRNAESVRSTGAMPQEEFERRTWAVAAARARVASGEADLAKVRAGSWSMDIAVAESELASARAAVEAVKTELERLTVKAPVAGDVLQVNIRAGEFAQSGALQTPLILFGDTSTMHVRVDVDENDAWRVRSGARARASLRGNAALATDVQFVRIEPYVVPKVSLTGDSSERVDTRVLQVIYSFPRGVLPVYVGQQMDVFIDGIPNPTGAAPPPAVDAAKK